MVKKVQKAYQTASSIYKRKLTKDALQAVTQAAKDTAFTQVTVKQFQEQAKVSFNTAFAVSAHYKELIVISKRVKETVTQPDELFNEDDDEEDNEEDNEEDSALSDKEVF